MTLSTIARIEAICASTRGTPHVDAWEVLAIMGEQLFTVREKFVEELVIAVAERRGSTSHSTLVIDMNSDDVRTAALATAKWDRERHVEAMGREGN